MKLEGMSLVDVASLTEEQAREALERIRWPNGAACPRCGDTAVTKLQGKSTRPGVYKCKGCRKPFTVTVGTVFHGSHVPLRKWILAFHLMCSSKKGVSALQLQRNLGLGSYKTAWHMAHRVRYAMRQEPLASILRGTVEVDETYVGGKPRLPREAREKWTSKAPVVALVERDGRARAFPVERVTANSLGGVLLKNVELNARVVTDEHAGYKMVAPFFRGGHATVNHSKGEYARGDVTTNTVESFFSLLKRGVYGTFHHVSKQHLHRYCDEFAFRWSTRKMGDARRVQEALRGAEGRRLTYKRILK